MGVLEHRIENSENIVKVRWRDGMVNEHHFPIGGIPIKDPHADAIIGVIPGDVAVEILRENSPLLTEEEFSWLNFRKYTEKLVRAADDSKSKKKGKK